LHTNTHTWFVLEVNKYFQHISNLVYLVSSIVVPLFNFGYYFSSYNLQFIVKGHYCEVMLGLGRSNGDLTDICYC